MRQPVRRLNAEKLEAAMLEFSQLERDEIIKMRWGPAPSWRNMWWPFGRSWRG